MQSNEVRIPKRDFDISATAQPCEYFKSTFARSLTANGQKAVKSLDFMINFGVKNVEIEPPPSMSTLSTAKAVTAARSLLYIEPSTQICDKIPNDTNTVQNIWITDTVKDEDKTEQEVSQSSTSPEIPIPIIIENGLSSTTKSSDMHPTSDFEVLRLRKECQTLIEENRRLIGLGEHRDNGSIHQNVVGKTIPSVVENVFLQTQIDTLSWQLKQVESSRQMYKAVMEEVSRFLEKCHRILDTIQPLHPTIGRSKSVVQVSKNHDSDSTDCSTGYSPRARSSTNLVDTTQPQDFKKRYHNVNSSASTLLDSDSIPIGPPSCSLYNNHRNLTWCRTQKRSQQISVPNEIEPEKLSKEAFRLFRTVQNLMNTQEPSLLYPESSPNTNLAKNEGESLPTTTFMRKANSRESRLSIHSSTGESVHSSNSSSGDTLSSKTETDEDTCIPSQVLPTLLPKDSLPPSNNTTVATSICPHIIDDESGFSSMNSFQDIGLPLISSTMRTNSASSTGSNDSTEIPTNISTDIDNKSNSVEKTVIVIKDKIGIPRIDHRRWDSAPVSSTRLQLSNDVSSQVLWV